MLWGVCFSGYFGLFGWLLILFELGCLGLWFRVYVGFGFVRGLLVLLVYVIL